MQEQPSGADSCIVLDPHVAAAQDAGPSDQEAAGQPESKAEEPGCADAVMLEAEVNEPGAGTPAAAEDDGERQQGGNSGAVDMQQAESQGEVNGLGYLVQASGGEEGGEDKQQEDGGVVGMADGAQEGGMQEGAVGGTQEEVPIKAQAGEPSPSEVAQAPIGLAQAFVGLSPKPVPAEGSAKPVQGQKGKKEKQGQKRTAEGGAVAGGTNGHTDKKPKKVHDKPKGAGQCHSGAQCCRKGHDLASINPLGQLWAV